MFRYLARHTAWSMWGQGNERTGRADEAGHPPVGLWSRPSPGWKMLPGRAMEVRVQYVHGVVWRWMTGFGWIREGGEREDTRYS